MESLWYETFDVKTTDCSVSRAMGNGKILLIFFFFQLLGNIGEFSDYLQTS